MADPQLTSFVWSVEGARHYLAFYGEYRSLCRRSMTNPHPDMHAMAKVTASITSQATRSRTDTPKMTQPTPASENQPVLLYKIDEAAKALGVSKSKVEKMVQAKQIDTVMLGRARRIHRDELERVAREGSN